MELAEVRSKLTQSWQKFAASWREHVKPSGTAAWTNRARSDAQEAGE